MVVTDDMKIALADDIIAHTAGLALISADFQSKLHAITQNSLDVRLLRYAQWTATGPATPSVSHEFSGSPPALPPRMGAERRC